MHIGNEENVRDIMMDEKHCGGSDAILHGKTTHPRVRSNPIFWVETDIIGIWNFP